MTTTNCSKSTVMNMLKEINSMSSMKRTLKDLSRYQKDLLEMEKLFESYMNNSLYHRILISVVYIKTVGPFYIFVNISLSFKKKLYKN